MGVNLDNPHIETGDAGNALQDWRFEGATAENTDRGRVYVRLIGGQLQLYKRRAAAAADLVAQGADASEADVVLAPQNGSGMTCTVYRRPGVIGDNATTGRAPMVYVWLCSERDLREQVDHLPGLLVTGEVHFGVPLRQTMSEFVTRMASIYPPPVGLGDPLSWSPSSQEHGRRGLPDASAEYFWSLNRWGEWEITGLQNPGDYHQWAVQQTLAKVFYRKARAGDAEDQWWSRYLVAQDEADRLWGLVRPSVDIDQDGIPDRKPVIRSTRIRRG